MWESHTETPGAGAYDVTTLANGDHATVADMRGEAAGYAFKTTVPRMAEHRPAQTAPEVGPGTYEMSRLNNGRAWSLAESSTDEASAKSAFVSGTKQGLTFAIDEEQPGPGAYDAQRLADGAGAHIGESCAAAASCTFMSTSVRGVSASEMTQQTTSHVGPGTYDVSKTNKGQSWGLSDGRGAGASASMKSKLPSGLQLETRDVPGPGSYEPRRRLDGTNATLADTSGEAHASSAFQSRVAIGGKAMWESHTETPGAGAYDVTTLANGDHATVADMRGEAAGYAFKTTVPRMAEHRPAQTAPEVGPGTYDIEKSRLGNDWAMTHTALLTTNAGTAAFLSDVARTGELFSR